jgi:hypothetical protein
MARIAGLEFEPIYIIKDDDDRLLSMRYRTTSNSTALAVGQNCGGNSSASNIEYRWSRKVYTAKEKYWFFVGKVEANHRTFYEGVVYNENVDNGILFSTEDKIEEDFFNFLMIKFPLPLLPEWKQYLFEEMYRKGFMSRVFNPLYVGNGSTTDKECEIVHGDRTIPSGRLYVLNALAVTEEALTSVVSDGLRAGKIFVDNKTHQVMDPLKVEGINDYMEQFSGNICSSLREKNLKPKEQRRMKNVEGLALMSRKLYAPQADSTNAVVAAVNAGDSYIFLSEEMGCGKTIQASAAVEAYYNQRWLKAHPGKTLKDCFLSGEVSYRVAVMCPSHLCEKWKHEVETQIPGARGIIVGRLEQLTALKKLGRKHRDGKEFYIFSKEIAKADTYKRPVPTELCKKVPVVPICQDCFKASLSEENEGHQKLLSKRGAYTANELRYGNMRKIGMELKNGVPTCPVCGGHNAHLMELDYPYSVRSDKEGEEYKTEYAYHGLKCPSCDSLLLKSSSVQVLTRSRVEDFTGYVLGVGSFATKTTTNEACPVCGSSLWEDNVEPLNIPLHGKPAPVERQTIVYDENGLPEIVEETPKWSKIKVCPDHAKAKLADQKRRVCSKGYYTLKGHELETVEAKGVGTEYIYSEREYGPRRYSLARFAKKYLKGYFDMLIADEAHLYEGDKTEQAMALHSLMKTVRFSMLLTGTLTNGTAGSLFNIHWMCNPGRMLELGYQFDAESAKRFSQVYGVVETKFQMSSNSDGEYNAQGKGRQVGAPAIKPGISPLVYPHLLLNNVVQLNIADMSNKLPPLYEHVVQVDMTDEQSRGYHSNLEAIKTALRTPPIGAGLIGKMLQLGLSYPDKPYGREPIFSLKVKDYLIVEPEELKEYESSERLLPKEEELVKIVNKEVGEGRNVFVYTEYSGSEETDIDGRLQEIIEKHCNLKGQVSVLKSTTVKAIDRELYIKKNSRTVKVFITNYRNVETGIDFVGEYEGRKFNYPTIVFFQTGMSLSSVWQASRRHYRLNQTEECRTYYLCYKNTFQLDMLEMMAKKMSAASAIQGNFSESALENMAGATEDPAVVLAKKIISGGTGGENSGEDIEAQMSLTRNLAVSACDESLYSGSEPVTFYEVMGEGEAYGSHMPRQEEVTVTAETVTEEVVHVNGFATLSSDELFGNMEDFFSELTSVSAEEAGKIKKKAQRPISGQVLLFAV